MAILRAGRVIKGWFGLERLPQSCKSRIRRPLMRTFPRSPRLRPLFLHRFLEACFIELHAEVASGIENKIHGQAVSVIKLERFLARINGTFLADKRLQLVFESAQPDVERLAKAFFL